jgi:two-component system, cell cycle response regulator DivK
MRVALMNTTIKDLVVLIVEDNVTNFSLMARLLRPLGVFCEWKSSGYEVVEYADAIPQVDFILMVIRLKKALKAGFDGFLGNPLNADRFPE